jgi:Ni,Fe-hydrogenase III large subunit/Ni,Fe-hydrogenase III component G
MTMENTSHLGVLPLWRERLVRSQWLMTAQAERDAGAVLLALWGSDERDRGEGFLVRAVLLGPARVSLLELPVPADAVRFPGLSEIFPAAGRMERALGDLLGLQAEDGDARPWLRHAAWPRDRFPLRHDFEPGPAPPLQPDNYLFVRVEGDGVHEIAVGPVHAGIIEPGHFRFSVVGEKVLRLEERLGYVHKGIEKRFESFALAEGHRLAARISGDSAVAHAWAYCMALEQLGSTVPPARALYLRALALELERIANHLGDLGALGNDAGFGVGLAQFTRLKEDLLRANARVFGARYLMDYVVPGGVAQDLSEDSRAALLALLPGLEASLLALRDIYDEHAGMQDRFVACGRVEPALAQKLGLMGLAGRASGQARDLRCDLRFAPYDRFTVNPAASSEGDVAARISVRFDEALESLRLCGLILRELPVGEIRNPPSPAPEAGIGLGLVEGWRGPVLTALEAGAGGRIRRCHPQDPSWQNWPVLEHAVIGNIVPDFPLINKSFNLSYSGHDL